MVAGFGLFHRERSVTGPHPRRYATPPPPSNEWERGPGGEGLSPASHILSHRFSHADLAVHDERMILPRPAIQVRSRLAKFV